MLAPTFDDNAGFRQAEEDLPVEEFVAQLGIEAFAIAVLPRRAGLDESRPGSDGGDPVPYGSGDEFRAVVGTNMPRHATEHKQVRQNIDDRGGIELAVDADRQAFPRELAAPNVVSSMTFNMRNFLPLWVRSSTKS